MNRQEILTSAYKAVADRETEYGTAVSNFQTIADLWTTILGDKISAPITIEEVAMLMCCVKLARLKYSPDHTDSAIDLAGYAALLGEIS
tara:strand:+ start:553 stop:819 length:267 start_codon:yes stop_codon:yes gene_type:complete